MSLGETPGALPKTAAELAAEKAAATETEAGATGTEVDVTDVASTKTNTEAETSDIKKTKNELVAEKEAADLAAKKEAIKKGGEAATDAADSVMKKPALPNNKFTEIYEGLNEELKKSGSSNGPLAAAAKIFYILAKYYGAFSAFMPDSSSNSLEEGSLKDEKLTTEQALLLEKRAEENMDPWTDEDEKVAPPDKYKKMDAEQASTRYVSSMLGLEELDGAMVLSARLSHSAENNQNYYKKYGQKDLSSLTAMTGLPKATVIVFKQGYTGPFISGYATGKGHQIAFFNAKTGNVEKFDLKSGKCSLGPVKFEVGLFPKLNTDAKFSEANATLTEKMSTTLERTKSDYKDQKVEIVKGSENYKDVETAVSSIISKDILKKIPLEIFESTKIELDKITDSVEKTASLKQFETTVKGYKDYLLAESTAVQALIEKEKAKIKKPTPADVAVAAPVVAPVAKKGQPKVADEKPTSTLVEKVIADYEKLDQYIKNTAIEVEKYLS